MKRIIIYTVAVACFALSANAQPLEAPKTKSRSTFAIVIDSMSYARVKEAVNAYRDAVERDGLGTYIVSRNWQSPEEIRALLEKLHGDPKAPLEGAVFVGDIPVAMIRDAQHLTSAFKMDQVRDWQQSSVPSDRYYDDFGLKFDFLKRDSVKTDYFYYTLRPDSRQSVSPAIYSARIKPLENGPKDKYALLDEYLRKVVAGRQAGPDRLDQMTSARGHGNSSESKLAWAAEQIMLKEQLPSLSMPGSYFKFMDFESRYPLKTTLFNEIVRDDLDVMLFHTHGSPRKQYINGYQSTSAVGGSINNIKLYLRSKILSALRDGKDSEAAIDRYVRSLGVPRQWCEEALDPKLIEADSIYNLSLDITLEEVLEVRPDARFVVLDACFNGSYHLDDYIAGAYIFGGGKTIATQANSVNAVQDKWAEEFMGLLAGGLRIGQWNRFNPFLESHIFGDPTYRFANTALDFDINEAVALHDGDTKYWLKKTGHPSCDVQCMVYRMLYRGGYPGLGKVLKDTYFSSQYEVVRLEAMRILARMGGPEFYDVLKAAVLDANELTRRFAVVYAARTGSDELLPAFAENMLVDNVSKRVMFNVSYKSRMFDQDKLASAIEKQAAGMKFYDRSDVVSEINGTRANLTTIERDMTLLKDTVSKAVEKGYVLLWFRNNPASWGAGPLLTFAADRSRSESLRREAIEVLGWFDMSWRREEIVEGLRAIAASDDTKEIRDEAQKSVNRLLRR